MMSDRTLSSVPKGDHLALALYTALYTSLKLFCSLRIASVQVEIQHRFDNYKKYCRQYSGSVMINF